MQHATLTQIRLRAGPTPAAQRIISAAKTPVQASGLDGPRALLYACFES